MSSPDYSQAVKDIIDGLGDSPTPDAIYHAVRNYSVDHVVAAAAAVATAGGGGGGGSQPDALLRGEFAEPGFGTSISNGGIASLGWSDQGVAGGPVLDLTDPTRPAVLVAGVYTVNVQVDPFDDMTADGYYELILELDSDGDNPIPVRNDGRLATAARPLPTVFVSNSWYLPAGGTMRLNVRNLDGASSRTFGISLAAVQQVE